MAYPLENTSLMEDQGNSGSQDELVKIRSIVDFIGKADDLAHFEVERGKDSCRRFMYKHHFITIGRNEESVTIVHYTESIFNGFFGIGEVKSDRYKFTDERLHSLVDIGKVYLVKHKFDPGLKRIQLRRMMEKMGERFYDVQDNNCEHFVNYVLHGDHRARNTEKMKTCALLVNLIISNLKSFSLIASLIISFVGIALSSIVRQSYVRILIALIISYIRQDNLDTCTSTVGKNIIENARQRIMAEQKILFQKYNEKAINNISLFIDSPLVCEKAEQLGSETLLKTSIYLTLIWSTLQTAFILTYNYIHLKPMRWICIQQRKLYLYRKYLYKEVFGGYVPIFCATAAVIVIQYNSSHPTIAFFLLICFISLFTRMIVVLVIELMFTKSPMRGRHDIVCAKFLVLIVFVVYFFLTLLHYFLPEKLDPF